MAYIRSKTKKGHKYYSVVESYRSSDGKTHQRTLEYIGPEKKLLEAAIRWREGSVADNSSATFRSYSHGATAALWKAADAVGLERIFDEAFDAKTVKGMPRGRVLLLGALHRAVDPGGETAFSRWAEGTSLPHHLQFKPSDLDSQAFREAMDGIEKVQIDAAQKRIVDRLQALFPDDLKNLRLDHATYHTWIDSRRRRCVMCQHDLNKQKRCDLRQFSLAMLTSGRLEVPLVWELYDNNKNDAGAFADFADKVARGMGTEIEGLTVCFDGDGNAEEALSSLPFHFVCTHSFTGLGHLLDIALDKYEVVDRGGSHTRTACRVDGLEFSGRTGTGILTISEDLKRSQEADLKKKESKLEKRLPEIAGRLKNPRSTLFTKLRVARRESERNALEACDHDSKLEADKAEESSRRQRSKAVCDFDETATMQGIVENEVFKDLACLRDFWEAKVVRDAEGAWSVSLSCDDAARKARCDRNFGKELTVTDRTEWETKEILSVYAEQESIEDFFKTTKRTDHFSVRSQFHWTKDRIYAHVFLCLCAVMLAEVLRRLVADSGVSLTKHALIDRLAGIRDGWVVSGEGKNAARVLEQMGESDRRLWKAVCAIEGATLGEYD